MLLEEFSSKLSLK